MSLSYGGAPRPKRTGIGDSEETRHTRKMGSSKTDNSRLADRLRIFDDEIRNVVDDGVGQAAGLAHERASVVLDVEVPLAFRAGDDLQQFRVERHGDYLYNAHAKWTRTSRASG